MHGAQDLAHDAIDRKGVDWRWILAVTLVIAAGVGVRLASARGDLWLDEIWSLELARLAGSAGGVFTAVHHDNNHHLNTLYLLLVGPNASPLVLRLLSVLASGAMLLVAAVSEGRRDRASGLAWAALLAASYLLVHYGSEARGYSLALLFSVLCFASMEALVRSGSGRHAMLFAVSAVLGLLSHLTFLYVLLAFVAWGAAIAVRGGPRAPSVWPLVTALAIPALAFVVLWSVDLRFLAVGGGPAYRLSDVLRELLDSTIGAPAGATDWIALAVVVLVAGLEVWRTARGGDLEWVFFVTVLLLGPAAVLLATQPEYLAPRYFLVAVPFLLLLLARTLSRLATMGRWPRLLAAGLAAAFVAANASRIAPLLRYGRGTYREAIEFIVRETPDRVITVGGDNDFRNPVVLEYHSRRVTGGSHVRYLPLAAWTRRDPAWVVVHRFRGAPPPEPSFVARSGRRYTLQRVFPYAGLSGWDWYVYRGDVGEDAR